VNLRGLMMLNRWFAISLDLRGKGGSAETINAH
jgi:hypothetical protein